MRKLTLALALMLAPTMALAAGSARTVNRILHVDSSLSANLLSGVACNAAASARTVDLTMKSGMARTEVHVYFTYNAATSVELTPTCSRDGTNYANYTTRSCSSGTCTLASMSDTIATGAADVDFKAVYDVASCTNFKVVVSCTGGGASDLFDVQAVSLTGGE